MNGTLVDIALLVIFAVLLVLAGRWCIRFRRRELARMEHCALLAAPENLMDACVRGENIPAMVEAALERARVFYGPDARLHVAGVGSPMAHHSGVFTATVRVRNCPPFPDRQSA